jgi:hypothetical protein
MTVVLAYISAGGTLVLIPLITLAIRMLNHRLDTADKRVDRISERVEQHGLALSAIRQSMTDNCPC